MSTITRTAKARSAALDELEEGRITPATYAERTIAEARELVRNTPTPERPDSERASD
jgi:hypothetical protein